MQDVSEGDPGSESLSDAIAALISQEVTCVGLYMKSVQVVLSFAVITIESDWRFYNSAQQLTDASCTLTDRRDFALWRLIGETLSSSDAPNTEHKATYLGFTGGWSLSVVAPHDGSTGYEIVRWKPYPGY